MKCNQEGCENEAAYRFTWPGQDEAGVCETHAENLRSIADAEGLYLGLQSLSTDGTIGEVLRITTNQ